MSSTHQNIWPIIVAAGSGRRFDAAKLKQYCLVHGKTILEHSINCFIPLSMSSKITVVLHKNDNEFAELAVANNPNILTVTGGKERLDSVFNGLKYLSLIADPNDWVLVHDAARPCLHHEDLMNLINNLIDDSVGGILASPSTDTLKIVDGLNIQTTLDRSKVFRAQTPQMFRLSVLLEAYTKAQNSNTIFTDDASVVEHMGLKPKIVISDHPNPKVTIFDDLQIVTALLNK